MLPSGYTVRPAVMDDVQAVADLITACDIAETGVQNIDPSVIRSDWEDPTFNLETESWLITAPDGQIAAYVDSHAYEEDREVFVDGYVHPDHLGRGLGKAMLTWAAARAEQQAAALPGDEPVVLRVAHSRQNERATQLVSQFGLTPVRHIYRMDIEFDSPPPVPQFPDGITVRTFVLGQDNYATYEAVEEAFEDHWAHARPPYEEWERVKIKVEGFDPSLWFLAMDGDEIAGVSLCKYRAGVPWVQGLGVRRAWRRRGIARALLMHTFNEFYRRGEHQVGLGVDASSPTGATRLYESAGMRPTQEHIVFEKRLK